MSLGGGGGGGGGEDKGMEGSDHEGIKGGVMYMERKKEGTGGGRGGGGGV